MQKSSVSSFSESLVSGTTASTEDSPNKKCHVCRKNFILRRKINCFICGYSFCTDHCTRKRFINNDPLPICNNCDLEETKKEIGEEIAAEIARVSTELKEIKEANESLFREHVNKASMVNDIEMELSKQEWNHKKYEQELASTLENEQNRGSRLRKAADELRNTLDELNNAEKKMSEQCSEAEFQLENLKLEKTQLEADKDELLANIEKVTQGLRQSLSIDELRKILCMSCIKLLNESTGKNLDIIETTKNFHRDSMMGNEASASKNCIVS